MFPFFSSYVCSWKDQPTDTLSDFHLVKIDQQTDGHVNRIQRVYSRKTPAIVSVRAEAFGNSGCIGLQIKQT